MDAAKVKKHQEILRRRREEIINALSHLAEEEVEFTGKTHFDRVDQAGDENVLRVVDGLRTNYLLELGRIDLALERIRDGSYGRCHGCRQQIEERRLEVSPEADFCSACQGMRERLEKV